MADNIKSRSQINVLEASAGSGKTYALSKHYLKLVMAFGDASGEMPIRNTLAITFTNKASLEMKTRIFELLKKIAMDSFVRPDERADIMGSLGIPEKEAKARASQLLDFIIANYSSFRVQTVDSFIKEIISGASFKLNLSARFEIRSDDGEYISRGLDALIESLGRDAEVKGIFREFIDQYLHIEQKTAWLPRKNILAVISELYGKSNTYGGRFSKAIEFSSKEIFALKKATLSKMKALYGLLPEKTNKIFKDKLTRIITGPGETFSIGSLGAYFAKEDLPLNKGAVRDDKTAELWAEIHEGITDIARAEALSYFNCYIDIYELVISRFEKLTAEDDVMFLSELNRRANEVFTGSGEDVPELYYRMSARFKHILIDEFQDTSVIQWKNVKPMAEEVLSNGGSLFYVGDKKQAIYRFRGGDAELFDKIHSEFPLIRTDIEVLGRNFRSRSVLIDFSNEMFSKDNVLRFIADYGSGNEEKTLLPSDAKKVADIYSGSKQEPGKDNPGGYVSVKYINAKNSDERDAFMKNEFTALVRSVSERFSFGDIAVLARQNSDIELFTGWLLEAGIPAESEKTLNLKMNPIIKEIISFIKFLDSPVDNAAFASFLLGDVFSKACGIERPEMERFLFETGQISAGRGYIYKSFRERYDGVWDTYFQEFFTGVGFMPVYELVVTVLSKFKVTANFARYQGFVSHLLGMIKEQEKEHGSLRDFLEYFDTAPEKDMYVRFSGGGSVRLMTVHKAKGLEFPVVIIPYLVMDISAAEGKGEAGSYYLRKAENGLSLIKLNRDYAAYSPELGRLYADNLKNSMIDELNTVYVSLTRAKDELYVYIPEKSGSSKNPVRLFAGKEFESGAKILRPGAKTARVNLLPSDDYGDWVKILKNEFSQEYAPQRMAAALAGEALHYGLSFVGNLKGSDIGKALAVVKERLESRYSGAADIDGLLSVIFEAVRAEALMGIFYIEDGRVLNEQEFIDNNGAVKRVDRLIETGGGLLVADYKSSAEAIEEHKAQVKGYMELLKNIYPEKKIEGAVVCLDKMTLEKIV